MRNKRLMNFKVILINFAFLIAISHFSFLISHLDKAEASALSLGLDPSIIEINAIPSSNVTSNLIIQNKSDSQIVLQIEIKPFKAKLENARPPATSSKQADTKQGAVAGEVGRGELQYLRENFPFLKNVHILDNGVPVENITLGPSQKKNLTLSINIPKDTDISARPPATSSKQADTKQGAVAGEVGPARQSNAQALAGGRDYYFSIIFISKNSLTPDSTASLNQLGIASNVLLSIGPKEAPNAALEEFSSNLFYKSGPVAFTVRIKNKGTHFIKPKGEILIINMFGQTIGKLELPAINILSGSTRSFPKALWKEDFLLGFYTATLNISLSKDGPSNTLSIHFFAFPFQSLILILIVILSAIIVVNRVRKHMKK